MARLLATEGVDATVVASHLLGAAAGHDPWVVATLREAATASRARGAPGIAAEYLRRALREPPEPDDRAELTLELGTLLLGSDPDAARHELLLARRLATASETRRRCTLALAQVLVLAGEFTAADELLAEDGDDDPAVVAARLTATRLGVETQQTRRLLVRSLQARASRTRQGLDSRLAAVLAIEACAAGRRCRSGSRPRSTGDRGARGAGGPRGREPAARGRRRARVRRALRGCRRRAAAHAGDQPRQRLGAERRRHVDGRVDRRRTAWRGRRRFGAGL